MKNHILLLSGLCCLVLEWPATAAPSRPLSQSMEALANNSVGRPNPRCEISVQTETDKETTGWITIGEARPNPLGGWQEVSNSIKCGVDSIIEPRPGPNGASLVPYLRWKVSTRATLFKANSLNPENLLHLVVFLSRRQLLDFNEKGEPRYLESAERRNFIMTERARVFFHLFASNQKQREAFGFDEVLLGIRVQVAEREGSTIYGTVSVSSDLDGARVLLDGGQVGTFSAGQEIHLTHVPIGEHEISLRDPSGRELRRVVNIAENRTVLVALNFRESDRRSSPYGLTPIGKNVQGYEEYQRKRDGGALVKIPAGEFLMGNPKTEGAPQEHRVYVSEFLMDKTAVTWGQYKKFAQATSTPMPPHLPYWGVFDNHPVVFVTWEEAKAYCEWVGGRLPTEAEREKGARGTDGRMYPWGNEEPSPDRGVYRHNWGEAATEAVGTHPSGASPYGLLDMGGNVWEWCSDWHDDKYYETSPSRDPQGPATGTAHVVRGGSWDSRPSVLSASCRNWGHRHYREGDFGFRCAMDPIE